MRTGVAFILLLLEAEAFIFFVHIPHTGGTDLSNRLNAAVWTNRSTKVATGSRASNRYKCHQLPAPHTELAWGHSVLSDLIHCGFEPRTMDSQVIQVTMLRETVSWVVSQGRNDQLLCLWFQSKQRDDFGQSTGVPTACKSLVKARKGARHRRYFDPKGLPINTSEALISALTNRPRFYAQRTSQTAWVADMGSNQSRDDVLARAKAVLREWEYMERGAGAFGDSSGTRHAAP